MPENYFLFETEGNRTGFFCECSFSATGNSCGINSINFSPQSFMIVDAFRSQINFEFSTGSGNFV